MNLAQLIARFRRIRWLQPSVLALLLANFIPLAAMFFFHWDVFSLLFLFWLENVIIGIVNILKMLFAGTGAKDLPPHGAMIFWVMKLFLIPFFCVHYGAFTFGHGVFIVGLFDRGAHHNFGEFGFPLIFQVIRDNHLEWPFAGVVISHLISFGWDYLWHGEFRHANPMDLMTQPYRRVVIMHVTIIVGGFLMLALRSPESGLIFLVFLKTSFDLSGHQNERDKYSQIKNPSPLSLATLQIPSLQTVLQSRMQAGAGQGIPARAIAVLMVFLIFCLGFVGFVGYPFFSPFINHAHRSQALVAVTAGPPVWKPKLIGVSIPETPAAGKFRGADFSVAHAVYANRKLSLRDGTGPDSRYFVISLNLSNNALPHASYDLSSSGTTGLPEIKMNWHENGSKKTSLETFGGGYCLKLKFGDPVKNKIPANIYLCLPDAQKSYLAGTFSVTIKKDKDSTASAGN